MLSKLSELPVNQSDMTKNFIKCAEVNNELVQVNNNINGSESISSNEEGVINTEKELCCKNNAKTIDNLNCVSVVCNQGKINSCANSEGSNVFENDLDDINGGDCAKLEMVDLGNREERSVDESKSFKENLALTVFDVSEQSKRDIYKSNILPINKFNIPNEKRLQSELCRVSLNNKYKLSGFYSELTPKYSRQVNQLRCVVLKHREHKEYVEHTLPLIQCIQQHIFQEVIQREVITNQEQRQRMNTKHKFMEMKEVLLEKELLQQHRMSISIFKEKQANEHNAQKLSCENEKMETESEIKERVKFLCVIEPKLNVLSVAINDWRNTESDLHTLCELLEEENKLIERCQMSSMGKAITTKNAEKDACNSTTHCRENDVNVNERVLTCWFRNCIVASFNTAAIIKDSSLRATIIPSPYVSNCSSSFDQKMIAIIHQAKEEECEKNLRNKENNIDSSSCNNSIDNVATNGRTDNTIIDVTDIDHNNRDSTNKYNNINDKWVIDGNNDNNTEEYKKETINSVHKRNEVNCTGNAHSSYTAIYSKSSLSPSSLATIKSKENVVATVYALSGVAVNNESGAIINNAVSVAEIFSKMFTKTSNNRSSNSFVKDDNNNVKSVNGAAGEYDVNEQVDKNSNTVTAADAAANQHVRFVWTKEAIIVLQQTRRLLCKAMKSKHHRSNSINEEIDTNKEDISISKNDSFTNNNSRRSSVNITNVDTNSLEEVIEHSSSVLKFDNITSAELSANTVKSIGTAICFPFTQHVQRK